MSSPQRSSESDRPAQAPMPSQSEGSEDEILEASSPTCYLVEFENLLKPPPNIQIKSIHEAPAPSDGTRIFVECAKPTKAEPVRDSTADWHQQLTPSTGLREWFLADPPMRWIEFRERYWNELNGRQEALSPCYAALQNGALTLIHDGCDARHNPALVLREYLLAHLP